ncbi:MAG: CHAP domain-containing protein [Candidatus Pararuminococcus gallinarum]|jgi:hypothetical protein
MATVKELLEIARGELGTKESPANSNRVKYSSWYGMTGPWCVMFIMWIFHYAGVALPTRTASCTTLMKAAKAAGCWVTSGYRDGDVVIFDWGGDKAPDHCGVIEHVLSNGYLTIEGNTAVGNDSDGGEVMRRTRTARQILGAVRPIYEEETGAPAGAQQSGSGGERTNTGMSALPALDGSKGYEGSEDEMDNTPAPAHKEGVEWAVENGILTGNADGDLMLSQPVTRQQMCTMLRRYDKLERE